jgi:hypothetical protein
LFFGIGNEVRTKDLKGNFPYEFPEPYGVEFNSQQMRKAGEFMVLNTHLIDIRGVRNKQACSECKCSETGIRGFLNVTEGGLTCCHSTYYDGGKCQVAHPEIPQTNQTYYIRYTLKWRDFTAATLPLEVITFDATDNNTKWGDLPFLPGGMPQSHSALKNDAVSWSRVNDGRSGDFDGKRACHIEWYVPACKAGDTCLISVKNSWELPYPMHIVFLRNHMHAPGTHMTTYTDSGFSCMGNATYDKEHNLIDVSTCAINDGSNSPGVHQLKRGEKIFVDSVYKQDELPHYGVMSMSFVYAHIPKDQYVQV